MVEKWIKNKNKNKIKEEEEEDDMVKKHSEYEIVEWVGKLSRML